MDEVCCTIIHGPANFVLFISVLKSLGCFEFADDCTGIIIYKSRVILLMCPFVFVSILISLNGSILAIYAAKMWNSDKR